MSVLQEDENNTHLMRNCKIDYLQTDNQRMQHQSSFLSDLVHHYKSIIELSQYGGETHSVQIQQINHRINTALLKQIEFCTQVKQQALKTKAEITVDDFLPFVMSFEEKIKRLQGDIKERESQLQTLEQGNEIQEQKVPSQTANAKITNFNDIHSKMLDRIKREVLKLKIKKKKLQNRLIAAKENREEESTQSTGVSQTRTGQDQASPLAGMDDMSTFEKVSLLLKKKRYQNDCMQAKINKMKMKIAESKDVSSLLKRQIQDSEWRCIQNIECGSGCVESYYNCDLSIAAGKSFYNNNTSFSFDISRFIKPRAHP